MWVYDQQSDGSHIEQSHRDTGCHHWLCNGYKRPGRKSARAKAKAQLRRKPEEA
jgi:hypothetical protein